jgi:phenylalanyl-tRNA synthetase alpha chain
MYRLTSEGREYLEKGLPERALLRALEPGRKSLVEIAAMPRSAIAIGWAKKHGWIEIIDNLFVQLTDHGRRALLEKTELELALESIAKTGKADPESLRMLITRRLAEPVKKPKLLERILAKPKPADIAQLTPELLKTGRWRELPFRKYDVTAPAPALWPGKRHIIQQFLERVRRIWIELGFREMRGPMAEVSFWNFDALYQPQDHPAREMADTFYLKPPEIGKLPTKELVDRVRRTHENGWTTGSSGWQLPWRSEVAAKVCLRTHTTSISARTLASLKPADLPAKYFAIGRCFRNETLDWKRLCEFHQVEGIVIDESVNFRHLLGYLRRFYTKLGYPGARFRPSYFPYTELSVEIEIFSPERRAWLELGGAGIFRPEVVKPLLGIDVPVLAWGPGVERLVMEAYKIADIRQLYANDLALLRAAKVR